MNSAFVKAFAERWGATIVPWKNPAGAGSSKGVVFTWPNGRKDWPNANDLTKWLNGQEA